MKTKIEMHKPTTLALDELRGAEYNPRVMPDAEMKNLMRSIRTYGFLQPVVARAEDKLILAGHQRIEALKRLVVESKQPASFSVPVVLVDNISDERAKLLNIALNRIQGDWDYDKLSGIFLEIRDLSLDDVGLDLSGFTEREIDNILLLHEDPIEVVGATSGEDAERNISEGLEAHARRFGFTLADNDAAKFCSEVLKRFGMTGPGNAAQAFVAALQAARSAAHDEGASEGAAGAQQLAQQAPKLQLDFISHEHRDAVKGVIAAAAKKNEPAGETLARMLKIASHAVPKAPLSPIPITPAKGGGKVTTVAATTEEEVQGVYGLWKKLTKQLGPPNPAAIRDAMQKGELLLAKAGGEFAGFVKFHVRKDGGITIYDIAVAPAHRKHGVGRALVREIQRRGAVRLKCTVDNDANDFYRALGFELQGVEQGKSRSLNVWHALQIIPSRRSRGAPSLRA